MRNHTTSGKKYFVDIQVYEPKMIIFLDETGCDKHDAVSCYGYSICGISMQSHTMFVRVQRIPVMEFWMFVSDRV